MKAIRLNANALKYSSDLIKSNYEIILEAVK